MALNHLITRVYTGIAVPFQEMPRCFRILKIDTAVNYEAREMAGGTFPHSMLTRQR